MPINRLVARIDNEEDGSFLVRAPTVGMVDGMPRQGVYLNAMEGFLTFTVLNQRHVLQLPHKVQGRVVEILVQDSHAAVEYNQPLLRLSQISEEASAAEGGSSKAAGQGEDADLIPVTAPSEGVFYRRPSPDSPCFVEEGSTVENGTVIGLVEVMKSFNQITYGGPGLPERGTVEKVLVQDSAEVAFGQKLILVRGE